MGSPRDEQARKRQLNTQTQLVSSLRPGQNRRTDLYCSLPGCQRAGIRPGSTGSDSPAGNRRTPRQEARGS